MVYCEFVSCNFLDGIYIRLPCSVLGLPKRNEPQWNFKEDKYNIYADPMQNDWYPIWSNFF